MAGVAFVTVDTTIVVCLFAGTESGRASSPPMIIHAASTAVTGSCVVSRDSVCYRL